MRLPYLSFLIAALVLVYSLGFQTRLPASLKLHSPSFPSEGISSVDKACYGEVHTSSLHAKKSEREEVEQIRGWRLVLLYMTPWKNPNSIFVYLLATLYILGTISEAQSAAGGTS